MRPFFVNYWCAKDVQLHTITLLATKEILIPIWKVLHSLVDVSQSSSTRYNFLLTLVMSLSIAVTFCFSEVVREKTNYDLYFFPGLYHRKHSEDSFCFYEHRSRKLRLRFRPVYHVETPRTFNNSAGANVHNCPNFAHPQGCVAQSHGVNPQHV